MDDEKSRRPRLTARVLSYSQDFTSVYRGVRALFIDVEMRGFDFESSDMNALMSAATSSGENIISTLRARSPWQNAYAMCCRHI